MKTDKDAYVTISACEIRSCDIDLPVTREQYSRIAAGEDPEKIIDDFWSILAVMFCRYADGEGIQYDVIAPEPGGPGEEAL